MLYPKKKSDLNKNNTQSKLSTKQLETRKLSLISKLSIALKLKYMSHFISVGYNEKDLIGDINSLLTPNLVQTTTQELFTTIEKGILSIVNQRSPIISHRITIAEESQPKKETVINPPTSHKLNNNTQSANVFSINDDSSLISTTERHDLVDKLRIRMEQASLPANNTNLNVHNDSSSLEIQKNLADKKCKQEEEMFQYLKKQIEEKERIKQRIINEDQSYIKDQINQMNKWQSEKEAVIEKKLQMQNNFRASLEVISKERKDLEASIRAQKRAIESNILKANRSSIEMDKEKILNTKNKKKELYQQLINDRNIYAEIKKKQKSNQLMIDNYYLAQFDEVMKKREKENQDIRLKIKNQFHAHDELEKKMTQIYTSETPKKKMYDIEYVKEREAIMKIADDAKQVEKEKKAKMIGEMKESLVECIKGKKEEKHLVKLSDIKYKEYLQRNYLQYLNEEDKKKEFIKEKQKIYKEELDNQIVDKRKREIEFLKQPIMPVKTTLTDNYREQY